MQIDLNDFSLNTLLTQLSPEQRDQFADEVAKVVRTNMYPLKLSKLELMLTEKCNLACDYCFLGTHGQGRDMSIETAEGAVKFFLENAAENQPLSIVHFGGEPTMALPLMKHVMDFVKVNAKPGQEISYQCTSNGTLITDEVAKFVAEYGVPVLISVDGIQEVHDRHRKFRDGRPSFEKVMEGIQTLQKYQGWVGARVTYTAETVDTLADSVIWLNQHGLAQFIIGAATGDTGWTEESLARIEPQWLRIADYYRKTRIEGQIPLRITDFEESLEELKNKLQYMWGCSAGRSSLCVTADGKFYGCARFATLKDCEGDYELGNLKEGFTRFDNVRDLQENRAIARNECFKCDLKVYCAGSCPAASQELHDNIYCIDPSSCKTVKTKHKLLSEQPDLCKLHIDYPIMHAHKQQPQVSDTAAEHIQPL